MSRGGGGQGSGPGSDGGRPHPFLAAPESKTLQGDPLAAPLLVAVAVGNEVLTNCTRWPRNRGRPAPGPGQKPVTQKASLEKSGTDGPQGKVSPKVRVPLETSCLGQVQLLPLSLVSVNEVLYPQDPSVDGGIGHPWPHSIMNAIPMGLFLSRKLTRKNVLVFLLSTRK